RGFAFGFELREFGFFPFFAAFDADAFEQLACRFHVGVLGAPICREVTAEGSRENALAQLLEQSRNGLERLPRAPAARLQRLELGDDATLLGEGGA
ncbi:MAG TPA: hypothetical protein VKP30_10195, partial [Polyangiaceae bacterium]|nr:hypothetical protein [Polyangiaceae bacterium]